MIEAIKAIIIVLILLILAYPLLPFNSKAKKFSTFYALRYDAPHNKKNLPFLLLTIVEFIAVAVLFNLIFGISDFLTAIPFVSGLLAKIGSKLEVSATVLVGIVLVNMIIIYSFVFLKGLLKRLVFDRIWGMKREKRKKKDKEKNADDGAAEEESTSEETAEAKAEEDEEESPTFLHSDEESAESTDDKKKEKEGSFLTDLSHLLSKPFFHGEEYQYSRPWVIRVVAVLQTFIYVVEAAYFALFALFLCAIFFPLPDIFYDTKNTRAF